METIRFKDGSGQDKHLATSGGDGSVSNPYISKSIVDMATNDLGRDAWGRPKVINDFTLFSALWTFHVPNRQWIHLSAPKNPGYPYTEHDIPIPKDNSAKYVSSKNGYLSVISDATENTTLKSASTMRYQPNKGYLYSSAHILPNPNQVGNREFGLNNGQSGVYFRITGSGSDWQMFAVRKTTIGGVKTETADNITTHVQAMIPSLDPSKGHVYDIQMQWRGVGNFMFYVDLQLIYTMNMLGTLTAMSVNNPALNVAYSCWGADADLELITGCVDVTSEGGHKSNKLYSSVTTGIEMVNTSRDAWKGTAVLAVKVPDYTTYNGHLVAYTRMLNLVRMSSFNKDESNTSIYTARLVYATNLDAISEGTDPTTEWTEHADSLYKYMTGGDGSALNTAFQLDKTAGKMSASYASRHEKDFALLIENPSSEDMTLNIVPGSLLVVVQTPDGAAQKGGATLEFAEEV